MMVLSSGTRSRVTLTMLATLLLAGTALVAAQSSSSEEQVFGTAEWMVESIVLDGAEVPLETGETSLVFVPDMPALAGTLGCNRATAHFTIGDEPGTISFGPILSTMMMCPDPAMSQERAAFDALELVDQYRLEGNRVVLTGPGAQLVLAPTPVGGAVEGAGDRAGLAAFNAAVASASEAGADWTAAALRVALAYVELHGAPTVTVSQTPTAMSPAQSNAAAAVEVHQRLLVTIVEEGLLDDSVAGVEQRVSLERVADHWAITGHEVIWQCRRGPESRLPEPLRCP